MSERGSTKLPPGALCYLNIRSTVELTVAVSVGAVLVLWGLDGSAQAWGLLALGLLAALGLAVELPMINRLHMRYTRYSVDPTFVYITRGALIQRSVLIPTRQILNVETVQGPLLRKFGFAKVRFKCITDVEGLGPLDPAAVLEIRSVVARLTPHSSA